MNIVKIVVIALISISSIIFAASIGLALYVILPRKQSMQKTLDTDVQKGWIDIVSWNLWEKEQVTINSPYGYTIQGTWLPVTHACGTMIFYHGHSWTRYGSLKYLPMFRNLGFNALIIDLRAHGASGGNTCTYGAREKDDGKACTDWVVAKTGGNHVIGLHGESLGAVAALLHSSEDPRIAFVIADSAFSSLEEELIFHYKKLTRAPLFPVFTITKLLIPLFAGGFRLQDSKPIQTIQTLRAPVLFIHGLADDFTPHTMSIALYEAIRAHGNAELALIPGARHSQAIAVNPTLYEGHVITFLHKYGIIQNPPQ